MPLKKIFFLNIFKNISGLPLKSMGKSGILTHTKHKVAVIQPQINLQFHFTVKLSKLGEIVKPIWLTGHAIWLTSCDTNVKTRLLLLNVK